MQVTAGYTAIPTIMAWTASMTGSQTQRAVALGMLNSVGQCLSVLAAFLFPTAEGPRYTKVRPRRLLKAFSILHLADPRDSFHQGASINIAFQVLGFTIAGCLTVWFRLENKKRDRREGGPPEKGVVLNVIEEYDLCVCLLPSSTLRRLPSDADVPTLVTLRSARGFRYTP